MLSSARRYFVRPCRWKAMIVVGEQTADEIRYFGASGV